MSPAEGGLELVDGCKGRPVVCRAASELTPQLTAIFSRPSASVASKSLAVPNSLLSVIPISMKYWNNWSSCSRT